MEFDKETGKIIQDKLEFEEKTKKKSKVGEGVASQDKDLGGFPHICKKCGWEFAEVRDLGIGWSDESAVHIFRCKKCGHTERHAEGTGNR